MRKLPVSWCGVYYCYLCVLCLTVGIASLNLQEFVQIVLL